MIMRKPLFFFTLLLCCIAGVAMAQDYKTIVIVAGHYITDQYSKTIQQGEGITGTVYYNRSQNTLYLEDVSITTEDYAILCKEDVRIVVSGTVTLKSTDDKDCISVVSGRNVVIETTTPGSKLNLVSHENAVGLMADAFLTVSGGLEVTCDAKYGIHGLNYNNSTGGFFSVTGSGTIITATGFTGSVSGLAKNLKYLDALYSSSSEVALVPAHHYGVSIGGRLQFSDANTSFDWGVSPYVEYGTVTYNPEKKVLTLDNATIDISSLRDAAAGIDIWGFDSETLSINYILLNTIKCSKKTGVTHSGISSKAGNLSFQGIKRDGYDASLRIYDGANGIIGTVKSSLDMKDANATIHGGISGFGSMTMDNCYISVPENGYYDTDKLAVCSRDGSVANDVSIKVGKLLLRGDINGDGFVNTTDVTVLYNVIFGTDTTTDRTICDLDGKGDINTTDVTELYNIMFGTAE